MAFCSGSSSLVTNIGTGCCASTWLLVSRETHWDLVFPGLLAVDSFELGLVSVWDEGVWTLEWNEMVFECSLVLI